jgi:DNA replication protein DnaC
VGKTFALVALLRQEAQPDGKGYVFFTMPELVRQLIGQASEDVLDQCLGAEVLAVDDVGAAYVKSDGLAEALFEQIVCEREASEAVTWLSTNLTVQRFGEVLGDRIADRVRGDGFLWYSLPGASLRHRRPRTEQPA